MPKARIYINRPIGLPPDEFWEDSGATLADVRAQFAAFENPDSVDVFINSPGGDLREGFAIHDYLNALSIPVTTIGEGKVWSIASVIFLAGDTRLMAPNATLLIHNPLTAIYGNADQLEEVTSFLRAAESDLADFYAAKTGQEKQMIADMMSAETELSANDSVTMNFATGLYEKVQVLAWISNNKVMSDNKKETDNILQRFARFLKNEGVVEEVQEGVTPEIQEGKDETPEPNPELEAAQKENEELKARISEMEEEGKETQKIMAEVLKKIEALENEPTVKSRTPVPSAGRKKDSGTIDANVISRNLQAKMNEWAEKFQK